MADGDDTCTWGEAVELGYLRNRRQPVACPPDRGKGMKRRHGLLLRLSVRGLAELTWLDGNPCFSVTPRGEACLARAKQEFEGKLAADKERNAARWRAFQARSAGITPEQRLAGFFAHALALTAEIRAMQASLRGSAAGIAAAVPGATVEGLLREVDRRYEEASASGPGPA